MATISERLREYVGITRAEREKAADTIDIMEAALEDIADSDNVENALDPERNKRLARNALALARGEK